MKETIILGVQIDRKSKDEIYKETLHLMEQNDGFRYIVTPNPEIILKTLHNESYLKILNNAALSAPDGIGLWFAGFLLGSKISERVRGRELTEYVVKYLNQKQKSLFIILMKGGLSSKDEVKQFFRKKYPFINLKILEIEKNKADFNLLMKEINKVKPNVILSTVGAPLQEEIINEIKKRKVHANLAMCVGGSVDYIIGKQKKPPKIFCALGLEWLWRLYKQPNRRSRIFNAVVRFPYEVFKWRLGMCFRYRHTVIGCIINSKKEVLVSRLSYLQEWSIPQGGLNENEDIKKAVLREMNEELGIEKKHFQIKLIKKYIYKYKWPKWARLTRGYKGQYQSLVILKFMGTDKDIDIQKGDEIDDYRWVFYKELVDAVEEKRKESAKIVHKILMEKI